MHMLLSAQALQVCSVQPVSRLWLILLFLYQNVSVAYSVD